MEAVMQTIIAHVNASWKWLGPLAVGFFGVWMIYSIGTLVWMFVEDPRKKFEG
ncbi:hypothetical protein PITCH_A1970007 [uncultured Desulfobacterium sp.]|uniref:Uncharacterized protein n=1 Tax=uncultured Desulfobacterium sp. TaxID=201089 RepID=A0A445MWE1_9BACT|nr:hypothetical protein PITCH_A1970007 [uncultured Desulfobacterium sp.]